MRTFALLMTGVATLLGTSGCASRYGPDGRETLAQCEARMELLREEADLDGRDYVVLETVDVERETTLQKEPLRKLKRKACRMGADAVLVLAEGETWKSGYAGSGVEVPHSAPHRREFATGAVIRWESSEGSENPAEE